MTASHATSAATTNSINLIDKDDCRSILLSFVKKFTNTRRAQAYEHFHEVRASHCIERHTSFACNSTSQQSLTSSWRTIKQHTARNASAQSLVARRILQEVFNLFNFFNSSLFASNVSKLSFRSLTFKQLATATSATHAKHTSTGTAYSAKHEPNHAKEEQYWSKRSNQIRNNAR